MNPHRPIFPETPAALVLVLVAALLGGAPQLVLAWKAEWIMPPGKPGVHVPQPAEEVSPPAADVTPGVGEQAASARDYTPGEDEQERT